MLQNKIVHPKERNINSNKIFIIQYIQSIEAKPIQAINQMNVRNKN